MVQARASGFGDREMVALSIRPERVMYSTEPVEGFTIKAVVREQIYAGSVLKAIAVLPNGNVNHLPPSTVSPVNQSVQRPSGR